METKELLRKIRRLEIKTRGLTKHIFSGEYHTAFKGRGMTFSEVRDYQYGDEVRTIDWNVTARLNTPHIKVFDEERELTVMLLIDVSGSVNFGSGERTKKDLALESAAILAFSAMSNNDKVGLILFSDRVNRYIPPSKGKKHALIILREIIEHRSDSNETNLAEALRFLRNTQKKPCIAFLMSDFIDSNDYVDALHIANRTHDLVALGLSDPAEEELPNIGLFPFFNAEKGGISWINTSNSTVRQQFTESRRNAQDALAKQMKRSGIDYVLLETEKDLIKPLMKLFRER